MTARIVEAVWVWSYGTTAQKATYGRFNEGGETGGFSKDYLQVSGRHGRLMEELFPPDPGSPQHALRLRSPGGLAEPGFVSHSADRAHLAWEINRPPAAWRMATRPMPDGPGTIPGNPSRLNIADALAELARYDASGITAYLVAVKLAGDDTGLHLRAYLRDPPGRLAFAYASWLPPLVLGLLGQLAGNRACASGRFAPADSLYFDPDHNHDAWSTSPPAAAVVPAGDDAAAEQLEADPVEVARLAARVAAGDFSAPDNTAMTKVRGSGQRVFADLVKGNYRNRCALTGIAAAEFLVASHIVPWSQDPSIRLDPANGICLSTLVDRAFDTGYLRIEVDRTVHVDWAKVGKDQELRKALAGLDGRRLSLPVADPPNPDHLRRRLAGFAGPATHG